MRLAELEPHFVRLERMVETRQFHRKDDYASDPAHVHTDACWEWRTGPIDYHHEVATLPEAQGVEFDDPVAHARGENSFRVLVWFRDRGIPDDAEPGPGRWVASGSDLTNLTLSPSVDLTLEGKKPGLWHGFVQNGVVRGAGDGD